MLQQQSLLHCLNDSQCYAHFRECRTLVESQFDNPDARQLYQITVRVDWAEGGEKRDFEITTLRKDVKCFGRHAKVQFTQDWKEDAARRDFTMNAMSITSSGELYDYFDGQKDLDQKKVKFVGNPAKRIKED